MSLRRDAPALGALLLAHSYALAMFSRSAGSVLVLALAATFQRDVAQVALIATVFFWVYGLLQVPAGLLADLLGSRRLAALGALTSGVGSLWFAAAGSVGTAVAARAVVAAGCAVVFVSMLRHVRTHWQPQRVATISGRCILVGNLGAIASAAPLSYLLVHVDWRIVSASLGIVSMLIGGLLWFVLVDVRGPAHRHVRIGSVARELRAVAANPHCHIGMLLMAGLAGSYYALASLWVLPMLLARGADAETAALGGSVLIAGFAAGACMLGWLGDRHGRRGTLAVACAGALLCWALLADGRVMGAIALGVLLFVLGFCSGSFNLVYALVTERNPVEHAGTATAFVNVGIFLGAGTAQWLSTRLYATSLGDFSVTLVPMLALSFMSLALSLSLLRRTRPALAR